MRVLTMERRIYKIYNQEDFNRITQGIKVAQCMQSRSSSVLDTERTLNQLDKLVVSDSLSCSFCNTIFEDQTQQRLHYKLDWHRYNLKQRLFGLKSISEDDFDIKADKDGVSSISGSETESDNDDESDASEMGESPDGDAKNSEAKSESIPTLESLEDSKIEKAKKATDSDSDSSDMECEEEEESNRKKQNLVAVASRHSKVFFENEEGNIFSIYRCLLYSKKEIPEADDEMITQALNSGKKTQWIIIMLGGGHFAAAVFRDGEPVVHKRFHTYTVRAKQGGSQSSRDHRVAGNHSKSAGASLRRYNEAAFVQHVQEILGSWSTHITTSSLILYRATGPFNRTVLFGGKNPPLDKNDPRLRPLPFPTCRASFNEVKRVYDILSTMEIYGAAAEFKDCFPISPRQPIRKKVCKSDLMDDKSQKGNGEGNSGGSTSSASCSAPDTEGLKGSRTIVKRQHRSPRTPIDRAKPRKSPRRPLPDIVARLAGCSSESESDEKQSSTDLLLDTPLVEQDFEIDFNEHLQAFQDTVPRYMKNKKTRRQKKKVKKERCDELSVNEILMDAKQKLWKACESGDTELLSSALKDLLAEIQRCTDLEDRANNGEGPEANSITPVTMSNVLTLVNDTNEDGDTMLHLAAVGGYLKIIWSLLEIGSDPGVKNKKSQTPYVVSADKETRNTFRRFMGANPDKFNYSKSKIPEPLTDAMEQEILEKRKQQKKMKRGKAKMKKKEFETKKQEEEAKQRFLNLSDREKRALAAERRIQQQWNMVTSRCFQCGSDMLGQVPFEYNSNQFCSMPCLKEHRLHNKVIL